MTYKIKQRYDKGRICLFKEGYKTTVELYLNVTHILLFFNVC